MKANKVLTIISLIIFLLQLAVEGVLAAIMIRLDVLPDKYLIILLAILAVLLLLSGLLMFLHGKKPVSIARRIIAWLLAVVIILGCGLVAKLTFDAYQTIHTVTTPPAEEAEIGSMYVLVRQDDPALTYADAANYHFGIIADYDEENVQQAILLIEEQAGGALKLSTYERTAENADALLAGQIDAWIVNGAAVVLLTEDEAYEDYMSKVRILGEFRLSSLRAEEPATEPPTEPTVPRTIDNAPFVVYISGSDTRNKKFRISRSDVNILGIVNPMTKQVLLINTPRDSYVPNPVGNGKRDKLTNCGLYGVDCSMEVLGTLYDVDIDYYCQINFTGFEKLIDAVGGITIYSDESFSTIKDFYIRKGKNHLNGEEALAFARERYHVKGGDRGRGKNQMKVITALIRKLTEGTTIITKYASILDSLNGLFRTSVTMEEISTLVKMQLNDMASWNIMSFSVTGEGGSNKTYSSPGHNAYVMYLDEKLVSYAAMLADRVIAGDILTEADMKVPE